MGKTDGIENGAKPKRMSGKSIHSLVEAAIMVALSAVLCYIRIIRFPWGGSVTLLSMLPIIVFSIRRGIKWGFAASFVFSLIQFMQGVFDGVFGWGLTPAMLTACILLDYILAFTALGIAGIFGNGSIGRAAGGTVLAIGLRFVCHVISGAVVFASAGKIWGFNIRNKWLYSAVYNGILMGIELAATLAAVLILYRLPQTRKLFKPEDGM